MSLFQRDPDQTFVTRFWLDYENETSVNNMKKIKNSDNMFTTVEGTKET